MLPQVPANSAVLPLRYLPHGLSSGDFGPALEQFLGSARRPVTGQDDGHLPDSQRVLKEPGPLREQMPGALEPTDSPDQASPSCHTSTCDADVPASRSFEGAPSSPGSSVISGSAVVWPSCTGLPSGIRTAATPP